MPSSTASKAERAKKIVRLLRKTYPDAECALVHDNALQLLVATILSAQCTDVRVNMVTKDLFRRYPTVEALADADLAELEKIIQSTGFFRNKARSLVGAAKAIVNNHGGQVPDKIEDLIELPGVARKTANVVLGTWYRKASGVVVDTHVQRLSRRLGLSREEDPKKIEQDLMALLPSEEWIDFSHRMIWHGRKICTARKPRCGECPLAACCPSAFKIS